MLSMAECRWIRRKRSMKLTRIPFPIASDLAKVTR